ncbi:hypothetical protein JKP88DRAFT_290729, partial [Tribonema minus]
MTPPPSPPPPPLPRRRSLCRCRRIDSTSLDDVYDATSSTTAGASRSGRHHRRRSLVTGLAKTAARTLRRRVARAKPRTHLTVAFVLIEAITLAVFLVANHRLRSVFAAAWNGVGADSIGSVHQGVTKKVAWLLKSLENVSFNRYVQVRGCARGGRAGVPLRARAVRQSPRVPTREARMRTAAWHCDGNATADGEREIMQTLRAVQTEFQVEYITLVHANATIWMSVNDAPRVGDAFDPAGAVTAAGAGGGRGVWLSARADLADMRLERAPLFRDRVSALDMAFAGGHPYETGLDGYMRWVVVPIYPPSPAQWSAPTDGTLPSGYVVVGDLGS